MAEHRVESALEARVASVVSRLAGRLSDGAPARAHLEAFAEAAGDAALAEDHPLRRLQRSLGLSETELDVLLLAALPEAHEMLAEAIRALHPDGAPRATLGLCAQLFANGDRAALRRAIETGPLVASGALAVGASGSLDARDLAPAEGLYAALLGLDVWPAGVRADASTALSAGLGSWLARDDVARARRALEHGDRCTILVRAETEALGIQRAAALVEAAGAEPLCLHAAAPVPRFAALAVVHALVRGKIPVVAASALDAGAPLFTGVPIPVVVVAGLGAVLEPGARPTIVVRAERLIFSERVALWSHVLPGSPEVARDLARRLTLDAVAAVGVVEDVLCFQRLEGRPPRSDEINALVRARVGAPSSPGVKLVRPVSTDADLVLPRDRRAQLDEAVERLEHQARVFDEWGLLPGRDGARGVRMLFSGPPGTGKTLAAEVLAHRLGVDLLVVDVSRLVSKWIGETEKNLAEAFDAAERSQAVLLFDEADALFASRTKIADAHDRYANLETAFLLSRLERFEGLAVLSTNLRQNIDPAFTRRLEFIVNFDEPGPGERRAIWESHLHGAPRHQDLDLDEVAGFYPLVGGLIRNAALAAAFRAAAAGGPIRAAHVIEAIRRECEKSGKTFPGLPRKLAAALGS